MMFYSFTEQTELLVDPDTFTATPQKRKSFHRRLHQFCRSPELRQLSALQTEPHTPKIEKLCWSRSCRCEAFIERMIPLTKRAKMSGQSSCAVIALISRSSQTQLQPTAFSDGVEPQHTIIPPHPTTPRALCVISLSQAPPIEPWWKRAKSL